MANATKRQVLSALSRIRKHYGFKPGEAGGPEIVAEYHGAYSTTPNAIAWFDGPYEGSVAVICGCETCGETIEMPKGTYAEPIDSCAIGLYTI